jgi:hypothetical protein
MRYEVTQNVREFVKEFRAIAEDLQRRWLVGASQEARSEWQAFLDQWPTDLDVKRGVVGRCEDDLAWMLAKARRFRAILGCTAPPPSWERSVGQPSP